MYKDEAYNHIAQLNLQKQRKEGKNVSQALESDDLGSYFNVMASSYDTSNRIKNLIPAFLSLINEHNRLKLKYAKEPTTGMCLTPSTAPNYLLMSSTKYSHCSNFQQIKMPRQGRNR